MWISMSTIYFKIAVTMLLFKHINRKAFPLFTFLLVPPLFCLLFFLLPPVGYFGYFAFFILYSFCLHSGQPTSSKLFDGLYPMVVESLLGRFLSLSFFPLFGVFIDHETKVSYFDLLAELLILPFYLLLVKSLRIRLQELKDGFGHRPFRHLLHFINFSMILYLILVYALVILQNFTPQADLYRMRLNGFYMILFFVLLLYINSASKERMEREIRAQKDSQLQALSDYSHHVEALYNELRSFRHDYINVLTSLRLGLAQQDLDAIQQIYDSVLKDSAKYLNDDKFDLAKLSRLEDNAVKSVLSAKLLEAQNKGISISVEIEDAIHDFKIELLDFIRILSILLDNAIEGSLTSLRPRIAIALIQDEDVLVLIVENSTGQEKLLTDPLFEPGYSSKGEGRGIGLANVRRILEKYPKSQIHTRSANFLFSQTIRFCI